jgi:hypothetical protein
MTGTVACCAVAVRGPVAGAADKRGSALSVGRFPERLWPEQGRCSSRVKWDDTLPAGVTGLGLRSALITAFRKLRYSIIMAQVVCTNC